MRSPVACLHQESGRDVASFLDRINREAIDGDLKKALRLCMQLGGETGSESLREWASLELLGYRGQEELPDYRKVHAPLQIDGQVFGGVVKRQTISSFDLPDYARDVITEEMLMVQSVPQLMELEHDARKEGAVRISPPGAAQLVTLMNHESQDPYQRIERMYWTVTRSVLQGLIEDIRSRLVALVAEMKAGVEPGQKLPSAEVATQAVDVVVHGDDNRVKVKQTGHKTTVSHGDQKGWPRKTLEVLAWVAGIVAVVILLWLNWGNLFG